MVHTLLSSVFKRNVIKDSTMKSIFTSESSQKVGKQNRKDQSSLYVVLGECDRFAEVTVALYATTVCLSETERHQL